MDSLTPATAQNLTGIGFDQPGHPSTERRIFENRFGVVYLQAH